MSDEGVAHVYAPAKVNLYLHVGAARPDGRHPLDSLVVFADDRAADRLTVTPAVRNQIEVTGPFALVSGADRDNLALHALEALQARGAGIAKYAISLEKQIPVAAGLGGGSADAGAVLRSLGAGSDITREALFRIAAELGGDVPACLLSAACLMRGDGDRVERLDQWPSIPALLVNPGLPCPTGPVFHRFDARAPAPPFSEMDPPMGLTVEQAIGWLSEHTRNDLEAPAMDLVPNISGVLGTLSTLDGAQLVRMSGSGASCFALFEDMAAAIDAAKVLERKQSQWWAKPTLLG